jgi:GNAT superfamily N-acetyltransferase
VHPTFEVPSEYSWTVSTGEDSRAIQESEWEELRTAVNHVFRPNGGDLTRDSPLLFDRANRENLRVIMRPGEAGAFPRVAAHAGFVTREALVLKRRVRVACIGAVFTAPAERGRGLASRVLLDALGRARLGADLVLASGDRGLYQRQGLDPVPPLTRFWLSPNASGNASGDASDMTGATQVRPASSDDLEAMAALYDAEDVHFVRPQNDWRRLWGAEMLVDVPAAFSVLLRRGRIVAYVVAQQAGRRADGSVRPRRILEIAGDRAAILEMAPLLGEELLLPAYDSSTTALCDGRGWTRTTRQLPITAQALIAAEIVIPWYGLNYL